MHFILIKPVFIDHLSYVTLFQCSHGRSYKIGFCNTGLANLTCLIQIPVNSKQKNGPLDVHYRHVSLFIYMVSVPVSYTDEGPGWLNELGSWIT